MPQDWYLVTLQALQDLWLGFLYAIPNLIGAVLVFVVGWVASSWAGCSITSSRIEDPVPVFAGAF